MNDLGTLAGDSCSFATGANNRGEVIGLSAPCDFSSSRLFYSKENGPLVDVSNLIVRGPALHGIFPAYISDHGEIAVFAISDHHARAYLIRPITDK